MSVPEYSIVIPVYNEEKRIPRNVDEICNYFKNRTETTEIIFVNDGSIDATVKILEEYRKKYQFEIITYPDNMGKGYAVRQGALSAKGKWVVFFDIDLATPLTAFEDLRGEVLDKAEIIIGSRRLQKSEVKKSVSSIRVFFGYGFTKISNLLVPGVSDFTCGFKCYSRKAVEIIFPRARINRWGFDTELLYIARLHGLPVREFPVRWTHDEHSKLKIINTIVSSVSELFQMKFNQLRGYYK